MLNKLASVSRSKTNNGNACRGLHRLLARDKELALPVQVSQVAVPIRAVRTRQVQDVLWPLLHLSSWAEYELGNGGEMFLSGCNLDSDWKQQLRQFWSRYKDIDPTHDVFDVEGDIGVYIPFMLHGDEGRGRNKQPLLTISFQCLHSHYGIHRLNSSGIL